MASCLKGAHNNLYILDSSEGEGARARRLSEWIGLGITGCYRKSWKTPAWDGFFTKCLISLGMLFFLLQSALATEDEGSYESSGISTPPRDPAASADPTHPLAGTLLEKEPYSVHRTEPPGAAESTRQQPAFSSILTILASTAKSPQTLVQPQVSPVTSGSGNQTNQWPSEEAGGGDDPSSSAPANTLTLSSSTGLTPRIHQSLFPPRPTSSSKLVVPLLSAFTASPSPQRDFVSQASSSSASLPHSSPSSPSPYALMAVTPFHNHLNSFNSVQISTRTAAPAPTRKKHFQKNTPVEPSAEPHFFGPSHFTNKLESAVSPTSGFVNNVFVILKRATQDFDDSIVQSKGTDFSYMTSQDSFSPPKRYSSIIWSTAKLQQSPSIYDTTFTVTENTIPTAPSTTTATTLATTTTTTAASPSTTTATSPAISTANTTTATTLATTTTAIATTLAATNTELTATANATTLATTTTTATSTVITTTAGAATLASTTTAIATTANATSLATITTTAATSTVITTSASGTTLASSMIPFSSYFFSLYRDSPTKRMAAFGSSDIQTVAGPVKLVSLVNSVTLATQGQHTSVGRGSPHVSVPGVTEGQLSSGETAPSFTASNIHSGSSEENTEAPFLAPSGNETKRAKYAEESLSRSHLHGTLSPVPLIRAPASTGRISSAPPVSSDASRATVIPLTSVSHTPPTEPFKHPVYSKHVAGPAGTGVFGQAGTAASLVFKIRECAAAETPLPSGAASALATSASVPATAIDSTAGSETRPRGSFTAPVTEAPASRREHRSGSLSLASVSSGSAPAAPGQQTGATPSPPLPSSPASLDPSPAGPKSAASLTTERPRGSVSGRAACDWSVPSGLRQSSSASYKSVPSPTWWLPAPARGSSADWPPTSESPGGEAEIGEPLASGDSSSSPLVSAGRGSLKAALGMVQRSTTSTLLNPASKDSFSQSAHTRVLGYRERLAALADSLPFAQPINVTAKLLRTANLAAARDSPRFTQASDDPGPNSAESKELNASPFHGCSGNSNREYAAAASQPASNANMQEAAKPVTVKPAYEVSVGETAQAMAHTHVGSNSPSKAYRTATANGAITSPVTSPGSAKDMSLSRNPRNIIHSVPPKDAASTFSSGANLPSVVGSMAIALSSEEMPAVTLSISASDVHISSVLNTPSPEIGLHSPAGLFLNEPFTKSVHGLPEYSISASTKAAGLGIPSSVAVTPATEPRLAVEESAFLIQRDESEASPPDLRSVYPSAVGMAFSENERNSEGDREADTTVRADTNAQGNARSATQGLLRRTSRAPPFKQAGGTSSPPATRSLPDSAFPRAGSVPGNENGSLPEDASLRRSAAATDARVTTPASVSRATGSGASAALSPLNERDGQLGSETPYSAAAPDFSRTSLPVSLPAQTPTGRPASRPVVSPQTASSPSDATSYASTSPSRAASSVASIPSAVTSFTASMPSAAAASTSASPMSSVPTASSSDSVVAEEIMTNDSSTDLPSLLSASGEADASSAKDATSPPAATARNATAAVPADNSTAPAVSPTVTSTTQETSTNATLQLTTVTASTAAMTTEVARTTTASTTTTVRPTTAARTTATAATTEATTADKATTAAPRTASPLTSTTSASTRSPKITAPTPGLHVTSTAESTPLLCNITERLWVKTVLSVHVRRNRLDGSLKLNLPKGLAQALQRAFNDSSVHAKVQSLTGDSNLTVGFYAFSAGVVFVPSAVVEALAAYGLDRLVADVRQFVPSVQPLPAAVSPWASSPAASQQLKTVLRFVASGDDVKTCSFVQRMEKRLENAFAEAESKALGSSSRLSVQILSSFQSLGSPAVSLIYVVRNGSAPLNGTVSSNLLNRLTTELVGYFLFFPPLVIAEPLEYHNLNTSAATREYWVITVIQDVDNSSLEGNYQSFASLMEQRLAELFMVAHQEGRRFRRAATVGSYTVQMVGIRRVPGPKSPAEMTYYVQLNGVPCSGTFAAKTLTTVDSQTMALTLGYFVQVQAEPVVKDPPSNLWIIAAVLVPIGVVTVVIIIITAVLCRRNRRDFKADALGNINSRAKTAYRREASYYHQPVQGFDYAKQHLGQQGGDEEALPVTQETMILPLPIRDAPLTQERGIYQDGSTSKKTLSNDIRKSRLPSEDGSVVSNESGKLNSGRGSLVQKVPPAQKLTKEEARKRTDPYDTSSGSLQLISIKPMAAPPSYSHPTSSDRSQDSTILNGEVSMALKQKSDIEHYRNKLRLKAKRKGYYDFPAVDGSSKSYALRQMHGHHSAQLDHSKSLDTEEERASTYIKSKRRHSQMATPACRSRQSISSPGPNATEMDLLVMRERSRRGVRSSGYDAFRFTQLPEMTMGSPPPPIPPRTGPPLMTSLRRSSSDIGPKSRTSECSVPEMQSSLDSDPYGPLSRVPLPAVTADQSLSHYSGNPITAVYAIPASRAGYSGYFAPTPPTSYRSPSWMSYPPEPEDLPHQWTDLVPLPGYTEAFLHPRYPQSSPVGLPRQYSLGSSSAHGASDRPLTPSTVASQESLMDPAAPPGDPLASLSTAVLVKAIREEVAKLAKKQMDVFEFQV